MNLAASNKRHLGFTLIELLVALGIFLVITGAAFTLLSTSQHRYQTESLVLTSFQEARLGLDQMVRDINDAGFPPPSFAGTIPAKFAITPFAWSTGAGYSGGPCQIGTAGGGTCITASVTNSPGDFDLIIETNPNIQDPASKVQWIRYQLVGTTLMRGVADKGPGGTDPDATTAAQEVPFVQNVVNSACPPQIPNCQTAYPGIFPGSAPVPIFSYACDNSAPPPATVLCLGPGADNAPANIRDVMITLIVAAPLADAKTGMPRLVQLNGRGRRINPNR
jgi:prepilin-type N-terminal cleavage/methylation domain-containing protein